MHRVPWIPALLLALVVGVATIPPAARAKSPARTVVDKESVAEKLVRQCAGIRENEIVLVSGGAGDLELLEDVCVQVRMAGAFPLLTVGSDRLTRRMYDDVPERYDTQTPLLDLKLLDLESAAIVVSYGDDPALLAHVPPARMAARSVAGQPVTELLYKREVRQVFLGNGLYPTAALAKQFALPKDQLEKLFWDAVNVDYGRLQAIAAGVRGAFEAGHDVRLTHPNGTDLRMRIDARPVFVSDGVISPEDVQKGGAGRQVWLPAGEVYLAPVPERTEGRIVVDRHFYQDAEVTGLVLEVHGGKVTAMSAKSGLERFKARYDAAGRGKDLISVIDVGINPNIAIPRGSKMLAFMPAGMVTLYLGENLWAGGTNMCDFGTAFFLPGCTLTVDDKALVDKGQLAASMLTP